ncbi:MAG TPA: hypothetical protein VGI10_02015 [Polyangiaceae bacterium]
MSLAVACKRQPEPEPTPAPIASAGEGQPASLPAPTPPQAALPAPAASQAPEQALSWKDPASFHRVEPKNPMRKASYEIPRAKGDSEDGELAVFYFGPGQGGGVDANVNRWIKQFGDVKPADVKRADRKANGLAEHTVEIVGGTFASGMPGGPSAAKSGYSLLGAIVETPSGPYFFKLTGPDKTVAEARKAFYGLLDSARVGS